MPSEPPASPPILVVDDDPDVRDVLAEDLTRRGYRVMQASDGADALLRLAENPGLRLVISDVRMPRLSGLELVERAAERFPAVRVVLMSGYFQEQSTGARFLRKPFTLQQLADIVQSELQSPPAA